MKTASILRRAINILKIGTAKATSAGDFEEGMAAVSNGNYNVAFSAFSNAAEQGYPGAQFNLALMYYKGHGVPQDYAQAVNWYRKAAEQGRPEAQYNLGVMYYKGEGVQQDFVQAHKWVNLAAVNGDEIPIKGRDAVASEMTPEQLAEAQKLAREWKPTNP